MEQTPGSGKLLALSTLGCREMVPKDVPASDAKLWRYMDFTKFVAMLNNKALYFCRLDHLGDPFEGAKGSKVLDEKIRPVLSRFSEARVPYRTGTESSRPDRRKCRGDGQ